LPDGALSDAAAMRAAMLRLLDDADLSERSTPMPAGFLFLSAAQAFVKSSVPSEPRSARKPARNQFGGW
jgi:hypothetical protein